MPTYDYVCDACEHKFELFQSIKDNPIKKCPECSKPKLRRLFGTGAAIMFKGSGFYQTDYRSESYKKAAAADSSAKSDSSGESSGSKSDASASKSDASTGSSSGGKSEAKASKSGGKGKSSDS